MFPLFPCKVVDYHGMMAPVSVNETLRIVFKTQLKFDFFQTWYVRETEGVIECNWKSCKNELRLELETAVGSKMALLGEYEFLGKDPRDNHWIM